MKEFNLSEWLQDKSRKVVTRDGREVRIVCWDLPGEYKIIGITDETDDGYTVINKKTDGTGGVSTNDLFFADEEEELTEFEKDLQIIISEASHWTSDDGSISTYCRFGDKEIKKISTQILDLARKELQPEIDKEVDEALKSRDDVVYLEGYDKGHQDTLKYLPKWKNINQVKAENHYAHIANGIINPSGYFISYDDLETLPKEE